MEYFNTAMVVQKEIKQSWINVIGNIFNRILLTCIALLGKLIFFTRDLIIWIVNILFSIMMLPLDAMLVILHLVLKTFDSDPDLADINTLRRLFWKGAPVSLGKRFSTLTTPKSIVEFGSGRIIHDGMRPTIRVWDGGTQYYSNLQHQPLHMNQQQSFPESNIYSRFDTSDQILNRQATKQPKTRYLGKRVYSKMLPRFPYLNLSSKSTT
jgi:hypothetical protein